jgi:tetratricopeptide (TPR) repeat protein
MVAALGHMCNRGLVAVENGAWQMKVPLETIDLEAPETLRQMIELRIDRLSVEEHLVLEVLSLLRKFPLSVTVGSTTSGMGPETFEELMEGLVRKHQIVRPAGFRNYRAGPSPCYEFVHVLYRQVVYSRIGPARRRKLHQSIAEISEPRVLLSEAERAAELAYQFEEGGDWQRAVKYLLLEADTAGRRFEPRQAVEILEHALELVSKIPEEERAEGEIGILQRLGVIYASARDARAVQIYEALADRAAHYGLTEVEVRALRDRAFPLAIHASADRYMQALQRSREALAHFGEGETLKRAAWGFLHTGQALSGKWAPEDIEEGTRLAAMLREAGDRRLLGEVQASLGNAFMNCSRYRDALRSAEEGFAIALEGYEENPYLSRSFQGYTYIVGRCLTFLGEWGEALRNFKQQKEMIEKNGDRASAMYTGLQRAQLHIHAMDFAEARQLCEAARPVTDATPIMRRLWLIWAGWAEAGLGNHESALKCLLTSREEMDQNPMISDWYFRMQLQQALTEAWLSKGDLKQARCEAKQFLNATLATEERMLRAQAYEVSARLAIAEQDWHRAQDLIAKAMHEMDGYEVPLAAWRVQSTAAELHRLMGNQDLAERHRELSCTTIMKLANSLAADEPLRETFLSAPIIRSILGN